MRSIKFLQPLVPHYREDFFKGIAGNKNISIYCYDTDKTFNKSNLGTSNIKNIQIGPILIYNPLPFLQNKGINILMLHFGHITTWLLLLTKFIHKKKIILWGQGISVKRYIKEEKKPSLALRLMISLADSIWLYTEKELEQWKKIFPNKNIISLNNTISKVDRIIDFEHEFTKENLKQQYKIKNEICFIFCARFNNSYRRVDLLLSLINQLDSNKYGFIIIGEGSYKPDFKKYVNVYDFGAVYDQSKKDDLFSIADLYLQPGWIGLSVVEALAYSKPVITFNRSEDVLQCVEYHYLKHEENAIIAKDLNDAVSQIQSLSIKDINKMGINARLYVKQNLTMENMVAQAQKTFTI